MKKFRTEKDCFGPIKIPSDRLWGAHTQRSLEHFSIGQDLMPREMIPSYAIVKKASAIVNYNQGQLSKFKSDLIIQVCDEILEGKFNEHFPLYVWMTGSGTQFNMNINEVIANRGSEIEKKPVGSYKPIHPNDDVNMSQSSNDTFPSVMNIAAALEIKHKLLPVINNLKNSLNTKSKSWKNIVKLGRTHLQDATPITLGQEFSGYVEMLNDNIEDIEKSLKNLYPLALGGTAVGTGLNTLKGFDTAVAKEIALMTKLPFVTAKNKFSVQGAHQALVQLSASLKTLAVSLYKIANDIRLLSCGPRGGFYELIIPSNEPGSSIMPGKINPTQCEALSMVAIQVMSNDVAVSFGGASGYLEMNVYKPLIIFNIMNSIRLLTDSSQSFDKFLVKDMKPNLEGIKHSVNNSLMLVTALSPVIGYEKSSKIVHHAIEKGLTLKESALDLKFIKAKDFDTLINPLEMCYPKN